MDLKSLIVGSIVLALLGFICAISIETGNFLLSGFVDLFLDMIKAVFLPIFDFLSKLFGGF